MSEKSTERVYRRWSILTLSSTVAVLAVLAAFTAYIDPLFHYHGPLDQYEYPLTNEERYQNDGITRNFEYSGIITGTSMTQNFKTSEAEALFGGTFIKVPFSGAFYKEINKNLERGFSAGKEIKYVIRGLDYDMLLFDKDHQKNYQFPTYLYNNNPFDDTDYILNKSILLSYTCRVLQHTASGGKTTTFDEYSNWNERVTFGAEAVLKYQSKEPCPPLEFTDEDRLTVSESIRQNVTDLADNYPGTTFYLFFTPYSICFWDNMHMRGEIDRYIDAEQTAIEELLKHPNINLYCFFTNFDIVCDLNNYKDTEHYGEWINSWILEQMHSENYLLTEENYREHLAAMREFYTSYDYASLHN